ncbi:hypothetical protein DUNSADRAFT_9769 [Dunaliella salina]|uniref:Encoded protein n=1 Tax=Dunaliella salina TaxID=3046 RepID=A0ABQ7GGQ2_DUNSA|nr:hypothetical protein DUNSADRAFT_9769 [Dunaliella salina]|eukprot:KAF5833784.1 hypothetical protein DUNSADRAFT_9769 [Dunaliella salina]
MRTLENPAQGDDLSSQPLTIETKALRSKSFNEVCRNSPFPLSTKRDGQSLKTRPTSLDLLQLSLTNSAGQQGLGPDGASLTLKKLTQWPRSPSGGSIFSPSPRVSNA